MSGGLISVGDKVIVDFGKEKIEAVVLSIHGIQILCAVNTAGRPEVSLWGSYWFEPYQITKESKK